MATITSERTASEYDEYWGKVLKVEVPAAYVNDLARSIAVEVKECGEWVQEQFEEQLTSPRSGNVASPLRSLQSNLSLFEQVRDAGGDTTIMGAREELSHALGVMVGSLAARLEAATAHPVPMGSVLDIATELRWVAAEAIRIEPSLGQQVEA